MADQAQKRSEAIERFLAEPEAMQHTPGSAFRAGYDAALADNAERVRELEQRVSDLKFALGEGAGWFDRFVDMRDKARASDAAHGDAKLERDNARAALAEARSIADRPLGTHIDYEPMDMIRDLQKALGTRVHDREPCRCGNVKDLAEARATIERARLKVAGAKGGGDNFYHLIDELTELLK